MAPYSDGQMSLTHSLNHSLNHSLTMMLNRRRNLVPYKPDKFIKSACITLWKLHIHIIKVFLASCNLMLGGPGGGGVPRNLLLLFCFN